MSSRARLRSGDAMLGSPFTTSPEVRQVPRERFNGIFGHVGTVFNLLARISPAVMFADHSERSASTGSIEAARLAGYRPNVTPVNTAIANAMMGAQG